jgi:hypothetical protein
MPEKMSKTDAVLYTIDRGTATIEACLRHGDADMRRVIRREWLVTVGASLDIARAEVERLRAVADAAIEHVVARDAVPTYPHEAADCVAWLDRRDAAEKALAAAVRALNAHDEGKEAKDG